MRIIAGRFKGHTIAAVPGRNTRPTTDRVREAWGSSVQSLLGSGFTDVLMLDAFAGSGALGLEACSRGAAGVVFADSSSQAINIIRQNIKTLGLESDRSLIPIRADVMSLSFITRLSDDARVSPFGLIALDPPYDLARQRVGLLLSRLIRAELLAPGALVSYECANTPQAGQNPPPDEEMRAAWPEELEMVSCKVYGGSAIEYYLYS